MDRKNIPIGGGHNKIEFCDIWSKNKKIIHVKHYGASSVLSHLISQGLNSAELFLADQTFREKVIERLPREHKIQNTSEKPNPQDYEIVYAIISSSKKNLNIPFFSKVSLRHALRRLQTFGYNVSIAKIQNVKTEL